MSGQNKIEAVARQFQIGENFFSAVPYGSGHINDTYCVTIHHNGSPVRYILQRINHSVFHNPIAVMDNIQRVTLHLAAKVSPEPDSCRLVLSLVPTQNDSTYYVDVDGNYWRAYRLIEKAHSYDEVESAEQAFQAAKAIGRFQQLLVDLPPPRLHETIRDFHNTPKRFKALEDAIISDVAGRVRFAGPEIEFALSRKSIGSILLEANLPERITHNDTKINNVLFDDATGDGICVIDLDTVMPGLVLHDFGDLVRTAASSAKEDETDLSKVAIQLPLFEALVQGYLTMAGNFLTTDEKRHLVFSGKVMTYEQGIRFLTDYLLGDAYYKVHHKQQNLDRCRTQFKLLESIEQQERAMDWIVQRAANSLARVE